LPPRATLIAYTDGLVERRGENLDVGLERLRQAASADDTPLDDLLSRIVERLTPDGSDDDTAVLGMRWHG
jgi:serine phosphatase RsbU (regulator of sigma subunit)